MVLSPDANRVSSRLFRRGSSTRTAQRGGSAFGWLPCAEFHLTASAELASTAFTKRAALGSSHDLVERGRSGFAGTTRRSTSQFSLKARRVDREDLPRGTTTRNRRWCDRSALFVDPWTLRRKGTNSIQSTRGKAAVVRAKRERFGWSIKVCI